MKADTGGGANDVNSCRDFKDTLHVLARHMSSHGHPSGTTRRGGTLVPASRCGRDSRGEKMR